ncbi:nitroreductase [Paenibacillus polymyxa]|uniref:nitroreductase n=1 Tax=Paenibacillus polymyxa TaxID=1406 RepID=UPI00234B50A9|nr:nitroreductase [Paenibacillus polymyxa]WCM60725.1 nitroreductase [Paenibacillus polymyxa]
METRTAIYERHSTRWFTNEVIPIEQVIDIVSDASQTPSWRNSQPWTTFIAHGETLQNIKREHVALVSAGHQGKSDMEWAHSYTWGQQSKTNMSHWDNQVLSVIGEKISLFGTAQANLFNAQAIIYLSLFEKTSPWSVLDLGAFTQTLMLSATDRGIQSINAYEFVKYPSNLRKHMPIPNDQLIIAGIALGFEDKQAKINEIRTDRNVRSQIIY